MTETAPPYGNEPPPKTPLQVLAAAIDETGGPLANVERLQAILVKYVPEMIEAVKAVNEKLYQLRDQQWLAEIDRVMPAGPRSKLIVPPPTRIH